MAAGIIIVSMPAAHRKERPVIGLLAKSLVEVRRSPAWVELAILAEERDFNLLVFVGGMLKSPLGFEAQGNLLYDFVTPSNVDGLIVTGSLGHYVGPEGLQEFCERFRPLPLVSLEVPLHGFSSVIPDFYAGMRAVMKHLVEDHGYRHIGFIRGASDSRTGEDRYRAYLDGLKSHGLQADPGLVAPGSFFPPSGAEAVRLLLDERKVSLEALVAANDHMAIDAMQALQARGMRIPEDIAVTGFDNLEIADSVVPRLTTVELPSQKEVRQAAEMLLRGRPAVERTAIGMDLVLRQSCGCQSLALRQAEAPVLPAAEETDAARMACDGLIALERSRLSIQEEMVKACGPSPCAEDRDLIAAWMDAFLQDLRDGGQEQCAAFLKKLANPSSSSPERVPLPAWQGVLSVHRRWTRPLLADRVVAQQAENLWQRGRILVSETALSLAAQQQFWDDRLDGTLRSVGESLITTFNLDDLMETVVRELPRLQIPACYIALYQDGAQRSTARLILAYNEKGRLPLGAEGLSFPTSAIVPPQVWPAGRRSSHVVYPLQFHADSLGFVVFEIGPRNGTIYETLSLQLSSALKGALLVEEMRQRADEMERHNLQLETSLEISRKIGSLASQETVTRTFVAMIRKRYRFRSVQYFRWKESELALGASSRPGGRRSVEEEDRFLLRAVHSPEPVRVDAAGGRLLLPVRAGNRPQGVLDIHGESVLRLTRQELAGLQALANQFGITLRNVDLYHEALQARETALQAQALAEKADELKTRLLANVTHELRAPLNVILGYSRMALLDPNPYQVDLPALLRRDLENINSSGEHLIRLINDLLDLSRAEIGELSLSPELVAPRALLEQAFHSMAGGAGSNPALAWKLELPPRLPVIQADPTRLRQVILNLLSNADKFTEAGEIVLGAEVVPPRLHVWVKDTGHGIPIERQERIFEPFFTACYDEKRPAGIGLGLAITRRLVALHGGALSLESQPGQGSIFHVYLPLPSLDGRPFQAPAQTGADRPAALLLISAVETVPAEIDAVVKRSGWEVHRVAAWAQLKAVIERAQPAVLAWDMEHARPGDWNMIQQMRSDPGLGHLPFLLFRKEAAGEGAATAPAVGLTNILTKPLNAQTLSDLIQSFQPSRAGGSILVVDDDPQARELYFRLVSERLPGYPVILAEDGSQALDWLERETPSLVILDLSMPQVDGFTVLERLRADPRTRSTPVFVLTGRLLSYEDIRRLDYGQVVLQFKRVLSEEETLRNLQRVFSGAEMIPQPTSRVVKQALVYLQQNYPHTISRPEIAAAVGVSEDYLSRIFSKETGLSPWEYLNRYRILQAKKLLAETNENITRIASMVGFDDPAYFSRVFQKVTNRSPRAFRTQT